MSNVLQQQHERMLTTYDILLNVKEMFGEQSRAARQVAMKALLNTKMVEGSPVQEHVLKMITHLNELEVLGAEVDGKPRSTSCSCHSLSLSIIFALLII